MKILLTGATGFIGGNFMRQALKTGHEVAALISPERAVPHDWAKLEKLSVLRGTLENPPLEQIQRFSPKACVHSAWVATPGVYLESPENLKLLSSSRHFINAVMDCGARQIVGLGTCIEYKIGSNPLAEDSTPLEPTTLYARCKNDLHEALQKDAEDRGVSLCWARVFYPYGPGEHPLRLCTSLIKKLRAGEKLVLKTPCSTKDYIHIDDLGSAILTVCENAFQGTINLGTGDGIAVRVIADTIASRLGRKDLVDEVSPPGIDPLGFVVANADRLRGLGWKPAFNIERGIESLVASVPA